MRTFKLILIILFAGFAANAQTIQKQIYIRDNQGMVLLLNDEVIGSIDMLRTIPAERVKELEIYREEKLSTKENLFYRNNEKAGLMVAKTNFDIETRTQGEINEFFGLISNNDIYVNGFLLENKEYKISSNSIAQIEVIGPDTIFLDKRVLNITIK